MQMSKQKHQSPEVTHVKNMKKRNNSNKPNQNQELPSLQHKELRLNVIICSSTLTDWCKKESKQSES